MITENGAGRYPAHRLAQNSAHIHTQGGYGKARLIFWEVTKGCNLRCVHCRATASEVNSTSDLCTQAARNIIDQISDVANPILVLSGGEPLFRLDIFELARYATSKGLRVALATNGTLVSRRVARQIVDAGIKRVAISFDGADAATHDSFRGVPGAFKAAISGFRNLKEFGMSLQINTTIARHNAHQLPEVLELAKSLGADALHTFMLVPVGCGVDIAAEQMLAPEEYEKILNWLYDRLLEREIELKATCAPHYFRIVHQRAAERREAERRAAEAETKLRTVADGAFLPDSINIGAADMMAPGSTGILLKAHKGNSQARTRSHPSDMKAMTKGCLAGTGVCFISHQGEVYPCGYLPVAAGDLRKQTFGEIWNGATVFEQLRASGNLKGKCGYCEFRKVCMGCRARAFAATGDFLDEEPFCNYQPKVTGQKIQSQLEQCVGAER